MLSPGAVAFDHGRPRRGDRSTEVEPSLDLTVLKHLALTFDQTGVLFGVTQALSAESVVQSNITYSNGHGYYSDPYKTLDTRPTHRAVSRQ